MDVVLSTHPSKDLAFRGVFVARFRAGHTLFKTPQITRFKSLKGQILVLTGATWGIGSVTARKAKAGAKLTPPTPKKH